MLGKERRKRLDILSTGQEVRHVSLASAFALFGASSLAVGCCFAGLDFVKFIQLRSLGI